jgi:tripartite-type tricarboxylate transporter receptor subunit TctC
VAGTYRVGKIRSNDLARIVDAIPTLIAAGLGAYRVAEWAGVLAPAGIPTDIVDRLNREFVIAARTPELITKLTENGNIVASSTPQEVSRLVADEVKDMEQLIKTLGLKVH